MIERKRLPARTRLLTRKECLYRTAAFSAGTLLLLMIGILSWPRSGAAWLVLVPASRTAFCAWTWWKYFWRLHRGNRTTQFKIFGLVLMSKSVTTTITVSEPVEPQMPWLVSVTVAGLLTVLALGWFVLSSIGLMSLHPLTTDVLPVVVMDLAIGIIVAFVWNRAWPRRASRTPDAD